MPESQQSLEWHGGLPNAGQRAYARHVHACNRERALQALLTGEHIEDIARMVFSYIEPTGDHLNEPTPADVADEILRYIADRIAPLVGERP